MFLVQRYYKLSFILGDGFCVPSKCNSDNACPSVGNVHSGMVKNTDFHFQRKNFFLLVSHLRLSQRKDDTAETVEETSNDYIAGNCIFK